MTSLLQRCRPLVAHPRFRVLLWLNLLLGFAYSFVGPFLSMFGTREAGMSPWAFGFFMTVTTLAGVGISTVLAHFSDTRLSRRRLLLAGGLAGAAGYVGYALVRDYVALLLIGSFVLGLSAVTFSQLFAHARDELAAAGIAEAERPFFTNAFRMFFALAWTVGPALASWVMVGWSYRGLFLCAAACFGLFVAEVWVVVPERAPAGAGPAAAKPVPLRAVLARRELAAHFAAFVLVFTASTIGMVNLPLMVLDELGGTPREVGIVYSVAPVFELPFMLWFGVLATRRPAASLIRLGVAIAVVYYAGLALVGTPWQVYGLQVLAAATTAVTAGVAITYFQSQLPNRPGTATNLYVNAMRIGSTIGYLLFGTLVGRLGHAGVFAACAGLTVLALGLLQVRARGPHAAAAPV